MFNVTLGEGGLNNTYQAPFPKETPCCRSGCGGTARIGFVVQEVTRDIASVQPNGPDAFVCHLHRNNPPSQWSPPAKQESESSVPAGDASEEGFWLHDCCAVAVYFCRACLNSTALYNQA